MRILSLASFAGALVALLSCHFSYAAGCSLSGDMLNDSFSTGDILVQRDAPVGSILYRKMLPATGAVLGNCGVGSYTKQMNLINLQPVSGYTDLFQSGLNGVGIRLQSGSNFLTGSTTESMSGPKSLKDDDSLTISLIKTGPIDPGALTPQDLLEVNYSTQDGGIITARKVMLTGGIVTQASCQVTTPSIVVSMGSLDKKELKGVNSVAGIRDFQIGLNCSKNTNVNVMFSPLGSSRENIQNLKGVVEGDSTTGAASGIGIQMLMNNIPVDFDILLPVGTTSSDGAFIVPLQARYYQILDKVTPGTVNAMVAFTMTYQ